MFTKIQFLRLLIFFWFWVYSQIWYANMMLATLPGLFLCCFKWTFYWKNGIETIFGLKFCYLISNFGLIEVVFWWVLPVCCPLDWIWQGTPLYCFWLMWDFWKERLYFLLDFDQILSEFCSQMWYQYDWQIYLKILTQKTKYCEKFSLILSECQDDGNQIWGESCV